MPRRPRGWFAARDRLSGGKLKQRIDTAALCKLPDSPMGRPEIDSCGNHELSLSPDCWPGDAKRSSPAGVSNSRAVPRRKKEARDGNRPLCAAVAVHLFCGGVADPVSRGYHLPLDAVGHISADRY